MAQSGGSAKKPAPAHSAAKKPAPAPAPKSAPAPTRQVSALERATELGYFGDNPMAVAIPNAMYALTSGPNGVSPHLERAVAARLLADRLDPSDGKAA